MEIAPEYVDVAIKRFQQNHPGVPVTLIATGQSFDDVAAKRWIEELVDESWLADKIEQWPTAKLLPYARNARTHSDDQVAQIAASIAEFGFTNPILAGQRRHHRRRARTVCRCAEAGLDIVPVVVLDHLTDPAPRLVIADNRIAENAGWDDAMLRIELETHCELPKVSIWTSPASTPTRWSELIAGDEPDNEGQTDEDAVPEVGETPISRPGDVWIMGQAPLLCGDSTVAVARPPDAGGRWRTWSSPTRPTT